MANFDRDVAASDAELTGRGGWWNFSWSAVWIGVVTGLALLTLLMLFGTALGLSSVDPYSITRNENSYALPAATIAWIVISALASAFVGGWIASYLSRADKDSSLLHGPVVWALGLVLTAFALGRMFEFSPRDVNTAENPTANSLAYSSLNDREFTGFVLERARNWRPGAAEEPVNVSAENRQRVDPEDVSDNGDLLKFVRTNTNLSESQAEDFLESDRNAIANAQAEAQKRWERENAVELARADRARKTASAAAWTLTAVAFLTLAAALGGAWLGWYNRDRSTFADRDYSRSGTPLSNDTTPPETAAEARRDVPPAV
ncbi:MAG TPA: hypothetical protein VEJ63_09250 [Planctomycetota bacterium]|nr:hypothetical protein [Planctomycetota bacterium]